MPRPVKLGVVIGDQQIDDQADDLARREVFTGGLVRDFQEPADQLVKEIAHLHILDGFGMKIDFGEALERVPEDATLLEALELIGKQDLVEKDVADIGRKLCDVVHQVLMELAGVLALELGKG